MALLLSTLFVAATALTLAMRVERRSVPVLLVAAYVLAYGEIVAVTLGLSAIDALGRSGYLVATGCTAVGAVALALARPVPAPPWRAALGAARRALASAPIAALAVTAAFSVAYASALGLLTPPNDDDALTYHLTRAALWLQEGGVRYVDGIDDMRVNGFPPGAEMLSAFTLAGAEDDRWVWAPQMIAVAALAVGAVAVARRLGFDHREALFGALLVPCFPIVAYQSQSALNDLPTAALLVSAAVLGLRGTRPALVACSIAIALALLTKFSAVLGVPVIGAVMLLAAWPRARAPLLALGGGVLVGAAWFVVNLAETGSPFGATTQSLSNLSRPDTSNEAIGGFGRALADILQVPGASGRDKAMFALAAVVLVALLLLRRSGRSSSRSTLVAAVIVAAVPLLLVLGELASRAQEQAWSLLDDERSATFARDWDGGRAEQNYVGMGPLGALLGVVGAILVVREVRRRALPRVALLLALAPLVQLVLIALALDRNPWVARFTIAAWTLAAATWGCALRVRALELAVPAIAATSVLLTWVHFADKRSGVRLLDPRTGTSVLRQPDWTVQATRSGIEPVLRFLHDDVGRDASVAVWPASFPDGDDFHEIPDLVPYLVYGGRVGRTMHQSRSPAEALREGATWYLAPTPSLRRSCVPGWTVRLETESGWTALERTPGRSCPTGAELIAG
jgi:hypothetical protein